MRRILIMIVSLCFLLLGSAVHAQDPPKRAITQIAGDLYRFQNNFHFSVFLVTDEGIIVTDPIDADAASWLKAELKQRFDKPIRYLIYSHDHRDHIAGGEVFADEAVVIAHTNAKDVIIGEKRPTAVPDVTFDERMSIELGGQLVELIHVGPSHSNNMIVMHFPAQRAVFAVDFISVNRLPYRDFSDGYMPNLIDAIKMVEAMDFDILLPGHGSVGTKADVTGHRQYVESLYNAVLAAAREGQTVEQMKETILLDDFKDFDQYEAWRGLNIEGMYRHISMHRRGN